MVERENVEAFKQCVRIAFDATGPTYGTAGDFHWQFAERLVRRVPLQAGQRVLDVATGTAPAAIIAARVVGATGQVIGVDLSPEMLAHACRNIVNAETPGVLLMEGDAERLPFVAKQFDAILCSSAIVWLPHIARALREWHRLLKPGGWLAFSCFGGQARYMTQTLLGAVLRPHGISYFDLNEPLNTPKKCRQVAEDAGFINVRVQIEEETSFTLDADESFAQAAGGLKRMQLQLNSMQLAQAHRQYVEAFVGLLATQEQWNHDWEQFVLAQRPPG